MICIQNGHDLCSPKVRRLCILHAAMANYSKLLSTSHIQPGFLEQHTEIDVTQQSYNAKRNYSLNQNHALPFCFFNNSIFQSIRTKSPRFGIHETLFCGEIGFTPNLSKLLDYRGHCYHHKHGSCCLYHCSLVSRGQ